MCAGFRVFFSDLPLMKQASLVSFCLDYAVPIDMHGLYQIHATYCHHFRLTYRDRRPTLHHRPSWESLVQTPWKTVKACLKWLKQFQHETWQPDFFKWFHVHLDISLSFGKQRLWQQTWPKHHRAHLLTQMYRILHKDSQQQQAPQTLLDLQALNISTST